MFEELTKFLPDFEKANGYGQWTEIEGKGTPEEPCRLPQINYGSLVMSVEKAVCGFHEEHPEFGLNHHAQILEENGLSWDSEVMEKADVFTLDGQAVMALLLGVIRAERFCNGALLSFFENGCVKRWIERLREIDDKEGSDN